MRFPTLVAAVAITGLVGCASPRGGGLAKEESFKIGIPMWTVKVKQGETKTVNVNLSRGDYFKQDVRLRLTASPGISVEPTSVLVRASDPPEVPIRISAPANAALGKYRVNVEGTPEQGAATGIDITVEVDEP
ncbi:MAG: hypothetical protein ABFD92_15815 [Planctomycetaceae bacterium]|nr:hypothetical protein [Planctomycetaceae bacterium]